MSFRRVDIGDRKRLTRPGTDRVRPDLIWAKVGKLIIDDSYQRPLSTRNWRSIERIAMNFDWARFTPLLIAPLEDGYFALVDGQHRAHAAALIGEEHVPAMLVPMTASAQASAFAWVNGNVTRITVFHIYRAALAAGETWASQCRDTVEAAGCRLRTSNAATRDKKARDVYSIGLIRRMVANGKGAAVTLGLNAIVRSEVGRGNREHYTNSVLQPWFEVIANDPALSPLDLERFCRLHDLADVRDRVSKLRATGDYRGISNIVLMRRSLVALLHAFAGKAPAPPVSAMPPPADGDDEQRLAAAMAAAAKKENARFRKVAHGHG